MILGFQTGSEPRGDEVAAQGHPLTLTREWQSGESSQVCLASQPLLATPALGDLISRVCYRLCEINPEAAFLPPRFLRPGGIPER